MPAEVCRAARTAEEVGGSAPVRMLARLGLVGYGIVHFLIGSSALVMAWGGSPRRSADTSGALQTLAAQPFGRLLLVLVAVGLAALAVWQGAEAVRGYRSHSGLRRARKPVAGAGRSVLYAALGVSAAAIALGHGSSGPRSQQRATSGVLALPAGRTIVVLAGVVIIGIGAVAVRRGLTKSFCKEIDTAAVSAAARAGLTRLGQVGHVAKGAALGIVGTTLGYAAWTFDPRKARGLDGALRTLLDQPFGRLLLTGVALGLMAFGLFAIAQSRVRRM